MISATDHQQSYAGVLHSWRGGGAEKVHLLQDVVPRLQTPGVSPPRQGGVTLQQYSWISFHGISCTIYYCCYMKIMKNVE